MLWKRMVVVIVLVLLTTDVLARRRKGKKKGKGKNKQNESNIPSLAEVTSGVRIHDPGYLDTDFTVKVTHGTVQEVERKRLQVAMNILRSQPGNSMVNGDLSKEADVIEEEMIYLNMLREMERSMKKGRIKTPETAHKAMEFMKNFGKTVKTAKQSVRERIQNSNTENRSTAGNKEWNELINQIETNKESGNEKQDMRRMADDSQTRKRRYLYNNPDGLWTKCIIPYTYGSDFDKAGQDAVQAVMKQMEKYTGFRFVHYNDSIPELYGLRHTNRINFIYGSGCWSYVGNIASEGQNISCCTGSTCMHELGHVIGFMHEQQNPLRDDYTRVEYSGINPDYWSQYYRDNLETALTFGYYDQSSVMHYGTWGFSINYKDTMTMLDPDHIDWLNRDPRYYYFFNEAQISHGCVDLYCPENKPTCHNGGYVSVVDGICQCICPSGLNSFPGCQGLVTGDYCWMSSSKYNGKIAWSQTGLKCQRWDSQSPHTHSRTNVDTFPDHTLFDAANYCRDPDGEGAPWCYTTDPTVRWQYCPIERCNEDYCWQKTIDYKGTVSQTKDGLFCQRWDSQAPHSHSFTESNFPDESLADAANFCRDPDQSGVLWCFTTDPTVIQGQCAVPQCGLEDKADCFTNSRTYNGQQSRTISSRTCQRWDSQSPHSHNFNNPEKFPESNVSEAQNFCRDPDESRAPWCYTIDPDVRWEYCEVKPCIERDVLEPPRPIFKWPIGMFTILKPVDGCPKGFAEGHMIHWPESYVWGSDPYHTSPPWKWYTTEHTFCTKTDPSRGGYYNTTWGPGEYCIFRYGGTCPEGFNTGYIHMANEAPKRSNVYSGVQPDGIHGNDTRWEFCCRNDSNYYKPVMLPRTEPFILFQKSHRGCQAVEGMHVVREYFNWNNDAEGARYGDDGYLPYMYKFNDQRFNLYFCYYTPKNYNCGGIIEITEKDDLRSSISIRSPNFPSNFYTSMECTWFIKSPGSTTLALDFKEFDISDCSNFLEIGYNLPGQPGIRYCGSEFEKTIVSHYNYIRLKFHAGPGTTSKGFDAQIRVLQDRDKCYTNKGKDFSYAGKLNYTEEFRPCLPWNEVQHCRFHRFSHGELDDQLDNNYCRNTGVGTSPWCYTNAETCARDYCDVCGIRSCYDVFSDCQHLINEDALYCDKNIDGEAQRGCMKTCDLCGKLPSCRTRSDCSFKNTGQRGPDLKPGYSTEELQCFNDCVTTRGCAAATYEETQCYLHPTNDPKRRFNNKGTILYLKDCSATLCNPPEALSDADAPYPTQEVYVVGDVVTYQCKTGDDRRTRTCTSEGTWTPLNFVCGACPNGWVQFKKSCYQWFDVAMTKNDAKSECKKYGAMVTTAKTVEETALLRRIVEIDEEESKNIWLAMNDIEIEGNHTWEDGEPLLWTNWGSGQPNNYWNQDCVQLEGNGFWDDTDCDSERSLVCKYIPAERVLCVDQLANCIDLIEETPEMCVEHVDFAWGNCPKSCGACTEGNAVTETAKVNQATCQDPETTGNLTKVAGGVTVTIGQVYRYSCNEGYSLADGNLVRACVLRGTLTGTEPVCLSNDDAVSFNNVMNIRRRSQTGSGQRAYIALNDMMTTPRNGEIIAWYFYSNSDITMAFQVWRGSNDSFELVGQNVVNRTQEDRKRTVDVAPEDRIQVQTGDYIGVYYQSTGGVCYNRCGLTYEPDAGNQLVVSSAVASVNDWVVGNNYAFTNDERDCKQFSLKALIGPAPGTT